MSTFELFHSYRRGWRDASLSLLKDTKFTEHKTRSDLADEYERGYKEGRKNYNENMDKAMKRIGYAPNVLRGTEGSA